MSVSFIPPYRFPFLHSAKFDLKGFLSSLVFVAHMRKSGTVPFRAGSIWTSLSPKTFKIF
jgi:hypothetical protein